MKDMATEESYVSLNVLSSILFFLFPKENETNPKRKKVKQINEMWMSPRAVNAPLELRRTVTLTINNLTCE